MDKVKDIVDSLIITDNVDEIDNVDALKKTL